MQKPEKMPWSKDDEPRIVLIDYTNHAGVRAIREILPLDFHHTSNQWHPEPQWLCEAFDYERDDVRYFAVSGIHRWGTPSDRRQMARQLQASIEKNTRATLRLNALADRLATEADPALRDMADDLRCITRDEDPS